MKPLSPHWADQTAARIVRQLADKKSYTVASGITPSGTVHIGNFREVITVDLVARALRSLGKEVRFIYSWDDFDTFRKVPVNLPLQEMLKSELRRPISRVPDAYGKYASYAEYNEKLFEEELQLMGIKPEYLYQHLRYGEGRYAASMREALEKRHIIREILDEFRKTPLSEDWLPTAIYCEKCDRDMMDYERYDGEWQYSYKCTSCGHEDSIDIRNTKNLKLNWRTDWPMRWAYESVDFEPGGKDHSSEGGSYDTAKTIVKKVWGVEPPEYLQYDFVSIKGDQKKMSSSSGTLLTLTQAFLVYDPQIIRWIFAGHRPNHDFSLAFDQDVIKTYEEFDRSEKSALGEPPADLSKWPLLRRTYELSCVSEAMPDKAPYRASFRELCNRLQLLSGNAEKTFKRYYQDAIKTEHEKDLFFMRCEKALNWLTHFAPDEFRYQVNASPVELEMSAPLKEAMASLRKLIESVDLDQIESPILNKQIFDEVIHKCSVDAKEFYAVVYQKLINRDKGPRLPSFLKEIGSQRILELI